MTDLFLSNSRIVIFLEQKKKTKITADTWRAFKLLVAVISLGYNNNLTKNRNISQPTARNLLDISTLNIKFSNESIPQVYRRKNRTL